MGSKLSTKLAFDLALKLATDLAGESTGGASAPNGFTVGMWTLSVGATSGTLTVDVTALPADNGSTITAIQYRIRESGGVFGSWTAFSPALSNTGIRDITGLTDGIEHDVEIRAVNGVGPGPASDQKSETPAAPGWRGAIPSLEADWRYGFGEDTTGGVLTWTDQVNGYTAVAPAAINSPTDGGDGWLFDQSVNSQYIESTDAMLLSVFDGLKSCTAIVVVDSVPASSEWVLSVLEDANDYYGLFFTAVSAATRRFASAGDALGDSNGGHSISGTFTVAVTYDGTTLRTGYNGSLSAGTIAGGALPILNIFRIGAAYNTTSGVDGKIKEVIACSAALNASELLEIHQQLAIEQLLALSPTALYVAHPDYLTLDGSDNVEVWADAVDPGDSTRWFEQPTAGNRPAFVPQGSSPFNSGVWAIQGDGVDDVLMNTTHAPLLAAFNNNNYEEYALAYRFNNTEALILTTITTGINARRDIIGTTSSILFRGTHNLTTVTGVGSSGGGRWVRHSYDGSTLSLHVDDTTEVTAADATTYTGLISEMCGETFSGSFSNTPLAVRIVFDRQLTVGERSIVESILAGLGGI